MPSESRTERIRQFITQSLVKMGANSESQIRETLLIKRGNYCGHRFKLDSYHAVWFVEEDQVKFFGPDGLLETTQPSIAIKSLEEEHRAAA